MIANIDYSRKYDTFSFSSREYMDEWVCYNYTDLNDPLEAIELITNKYFNIIESENPDIHLDLDKFISVLHKYKDYLEFKISYFHRNVKTDWRYNPKTKTEFEFKTLLAVERHKNRVKS